MFFAVLLVGVSIGQVLPHVQQLVAARRAALTLEAIVTRVREVARVRGVMYTPEGIAFHCVI